MAAAPRCRLLCYGDSLTAGYYCMGSCWEPYAPALAAGLRQLGIADAEAAAIGLSGLTAVELAEGMDCAALQDCCGITGAGLRAALKESASGGGCFRAAVIMAGTNDLCRTDAQDTVAALLQLHCAALAEGARTVAVGVPEAAFLRRHEEGRQRRDAINTALRIWAERMAPAVLYVAPPVPFDDENGDWEGDGLHMSQQGYQKLGSRLAPLLADFVRDPAPRPPPPLPPADGMAAAARELVAAARAAERPAGSA
eukprot:TRINITY_DN35323_c0_g1_i1.p1 TRINITY_DN35323_c0_g1~~TRINITY_DN35323_c0_g1_i1.p1  ORF type:complete len:281 (+),score=108.00 TRINITY_DN35323_c0_g1_i1:82-843(+)